ncbi:thiamine diphosphokinase [Entomospira entomophila]|uniref:Thiamine diphosphokinase n=1 Tax=Entomospira entomophila TaxID=2719988 RepID=A0A968GCN4_9SPIO|nr:thiamine diphosphokinase [Entomospira entomophilus]NIZ41183.1 thiamine diphosphokinase [Entomospira entomophilus]WDI35390.1 thiamine diphosphokinase [Entomospira entomophilus]
MFYHPIFSNCDALIFTGGSYPSSTRWMSLLQNDPLIIAADSGLLQLQQTSVSVHHIVGDFDSLPSAEKVLAQYTHIPIHRSNREKDETDTELALLLAKEQNAQYPILIGGGEGRMDHLLAIMQLFTTNLAPAGWITAKEYILPIYPDTPFVLSQMAGETISFYPLIPPSKPIHTEGLQWPFTDLDYLYSKMSISNVIHDDKMTLRIDDGLLLAIIPFSTI